MLAFLFKLARIIFIVVIVRYVVHWLFFRDRSPLPSRTHGGMDSQASRTVVGEARRDPVCGTFVSTELSVKALVGGQEHHFCSSECRDKWILDYGFERPENPQSAIPHPPSEIQRGRV